MERSLYWYIGSLHILTSTYTTALTAKQVARKVLFPPRLIEHIPLSQIKMTYTIFYVKIATFQKKVTPVFPSNPPLKVEVLSSPPLLENLVGGSTPPPCRKGVVHTMLWLSSKSFSIYQPAPITQ